MVVFGPIYFTLQPKINPTMPVPDFQSIMLPFLKFGSDGNEHTPREAVEFLAIEFGLSESEREELLPSGTQRIFENRVAWTKTHLLKAGLVESPRRSYFMITERGKGMFWNKSPSQINHSFLKRQFPEYVEFQSPKRDENSTQEVNQPVAELSTQTPEETLDSSIPKHPENPFSRPAGQNSLFVTCFL